MAGQVHNVSVSLSAGGTLAIGTSYNLAFKAPTDALGGGITVTSCGIASQAAIAAGSSPLYELVTLGTSSAPNGTIGTIAAAAFAAGTVREMTITNSGWVDAPYYVALKSMGTAINGAQLFVTAYIQYMMGK